MKTEKNMKVLFIDPICLPGHLNFNKIHVGELLKEFKNISFCFTEEYANKLGIPKEKIAYVISDADVNYSNGIRYRWSIFKVLFKIKRKIRLHDYDAIIVSCYDEISLKLSSFPSSYIINHNNICNLTNRIKQYFFRSVSKTHCHLVLNDRSLKYLCDLGIKRVVRIGHGLITPYENKYPKTGNKNFTIFAPSLKSTDFNFVKQLISNDDFGRYLVINNIDLIIRGEYNIQNSVNIVQIKGRISEEDYIRTFLSADCILICYPNSFKYRVSGVLLEAIANQKKCIIRDSLDFEEYKCIFGSEAFFDDLQTLKKAIDYVKDDKYNLNLKTDNLAKLFPNYSFIKEVKKI